MSDIKRIDIKEFRERGYLQELNRRFLHPLGMALEVAQEDDGTETLGGVWDYRDDPEGMVFGVGSLAPDEELEVFQRHVENVNSDWLEKANVRLAKFGFMVQPIEDIRSRT